MSYQLFFRLFNYRRSTTLSRTLQAFKSRGTTSALWYSLSKKYYISPLVYCNAWHTLFEPGDQLDDPLLYYDLIQEPYEDDSDDVQNDSFVSDSIVKKRTRKKRKTSKKINFSRRRI